MGNRLTGRKSSKSLTPNQENASRKDSSDALSPSADPEGNVTLNNMNSINPDSQLPEMVKTVVEQTQTATSITDIVPQDLSDRIMEEVTAAGIKMASEVINNEFGKIHDTIEKASSSEESKQATPSSPIVTPPTPQPSLDSSLPTELSKETASIEKSAPLDEPVVEEPKVEDSPKVEAAVVEVPDAVTPVVEEPVVEAPAVKESGIVCESSNVESTAETLPEPPVTIIESSTDVAPEAAVSEPECDQKSTEETPKVEVPKVELLTETPAADETPIVETQVSETSTQPESVPEKLAEGGLEQDKSETPVEANINIATPSEITPAEAVSECSKEDQGLRETEIEITKTNETPILDQSEDSLLTKDGNVGTEVPHDQQPSEEKVEEKADAQDASVAPLTETVPSETATENGISESTDNNNSGLIEGIKSSPVVEELKSAAIDQINNLTATDLVSNETITTVSNGISE